ncbi:MBL fold metallo-hydrolase [Adhaeribacter rhizoryzae]|uniref:MBL fold metallo-hydrolase n=1 Tax=Adhaeribacter rhizoryzae TaxID=2607907 RepID=A0A5M6DDT8_9BACT|nr:MBL fold metallo-hydrolase [Adhaeribacter rhizoryzae]KAA5545731.1 MBL fold metallo-hydrolase [Adhaeribacter rhizoryzae]
MQSHTKAIYQNLKRNDFLTVAPGVSCLQIVMVNVYLISDPADTSGNWVLVDAGLAGSANRIKRAAEKLYGKGTKPQAIILTHGHFDHVGALRQLLEEWDVPVYAHLLELPYLTGRSAYPPPDPTVGGGGMAFMSRIYPNKPIDISRQVQALPNDGTVPHLPGWTFLHTPGHTAGHISLFRDSDSVLIAGDAFVTVRQESMLAVMTQKQEVHGPPAYYTPNWEAAKRSLERLWLLRPKVAATGHGLPMYGEELLDQLGLLFREFDERALPSQGRYIKQPAEADESGVISLPPPVPDPVPKVLVGVGLVALAGMAVLAIRRRNNTIDFIDKSFLAGIAKF